MPGQRPSARRSSYPAATRGPGRQGTAARTALRACIDTPVSKCEPHGKVETVGRLRHGNLSGNVKPNRAHNRVIAQTDAGCLQKMKVPERVERVARIVK